MGMLISYTYKYRYFMDINQCSCYGNIFQCYVKFSSYSNETQKLFNQS